MKIAARLCSLVAALACALLATPAVADGSHSKNSKEAQGTPYVVGEWKFVPGGSSPSVDTEFRFINPTSQTVTLEYAFFELDGTFCGCDRDTFQPNKTTVYTMLGESLLPAPVTTTFPFVFNCKGTAGALKSIVFRNKGEEIFLDDASQVGFQTTAFGNVIEGGTSPNFDSVQGNVMTQAGLISVPITETTRDEIRNIHKDCVLINGPLTSP